MAGYSDALTQGSQQGYQERSTQCQEYMTSFPDFVDAIHFSKLDAAQSNRNVPLAKESQALITFNTHKIRSKFLRKPFSLRMSKRHFQKKD